MEGNRAWIISAACTAGGYRDDDWDPVFSEMVDKMARLEKAVKPHLRRLKNLAAD